MYYNNGQWEDGEKPRVKLLVVFTAWQKQGAKEPQSVLYQIINRSATLSLYV